MKNAHVSPQPVGARASILSSESAAGACVTPSTVVARAYVPTPISTESAHTFAIAWVDLPAFVPQEWSAVVGNAHAPPVVAVASRA